MFVIALLVCTLVPSLFTEQLFIVAAMASLQQIMRVACSATKKALGFHLLAWQVESETSPMDWYHCLRVSMRTALVLPLH